MGEAAESMTDGAARGPRHAPDRTAGARVSQGTPRDAEAGPKSAGSHRWPAAAGARR